MEMFCNVYASSDGEYRIGCGMPSRVLASDMARLNRKMNGDRCLYRLRIRPKPGFTFQS